MKREIPKDIDDVLAAALGPDNVFARFAPESMPSLPPGARKDTYFETAAEIEVQRKRRKASADRGGN